MRADRLLSILLLLQVHQRITARDLAQRLEVSERTIHRDMDILSGAGIPVTAERGAGGGWALLDDYRTDLTGLNAAEIQTLFLATPTRLLADLGLRQAADAALIKLLAALPSVARQGAEYARQRIHVDAAGWQQSRDDVPILPLLQEAIWQERRVALGYRRGDGTTVERVVDPLGLVAKGSLWYLIAAADGETRTYRVSRVGSAVITDERCAPGRFRPGGVLGAGVGQLPGQSTALPRHTARGLRHRRAWVTTRASKGLGRREPMAGRPSRCSSNWRRMPARACSASGRASKCWSRGRCATRSSGAPRASPLYISRFLTGTWREDKANLGSKHRRQFTAPAEWCCQAIGSW